MPTIAVPTVAIRPAPGLAPAAAALRLALAAALAGAAPAFAKGDEAADAEPMQQVTIVGASESGYDVKSTSTATKTDTLLRDTPQAITVVSKALIRDQAMQSMADVIRYVPGIVASQGEGNRDAAVFRGSSSTGDFYIDGIRDDVQYFRDLYNIERVEAIKGANAMIFGRGGSGGVINRVSKQPEWHTVREGSLTIGSWSNRRATADLGQAVNGQLAFRVNGMAENADSFRDGVHVKRAGINPIVAIRPGAATSIVLGYEHLRDDRTADRGITSEGGRPIDSDPSTFFGNAGNSPTWARVNAFTALLGHDFGDGVNLRNRTRYAGYDKFYQNVYPSAAVKDGRLTLSAYNNATERSNLFNQTDLTFSVVTGGIRHKLATGAEFGRQVTDNRRNTGYFGAATSYPVSAANPSTDAAISFRASATDADNHGTATTAALYLQDQITFSPQWQAVVGLRYDRFNVDFVDKRSRAPVHTEITDTPFSPRVGLVYKPFEAMSIYAGYGRAFVPRAGDQLSSLNPSNSAFDPEKFTNIELGAKWDISRKLSATAAIYQLDRTNVALTLVDPQDPARTVLVLADGQRSTGVELGLSGNVSAKWSVMGGYAWQDAKLTAAQSPAIPAGTTVPHVPAHTASLWNRYEVTPAFAAGLGMVYRDRIYSSASNKVVLPAFTRVDGALFYTIDKHYQLQMNLENLFDKQYYASANSDTNISPGSPRAVRVTLNAAF